MDFNDNNKPIYLQIVDRICEQILSKDLIEGGRMPSVREYAAEIQVNANTVMRAYEYLSSKEIIFNKRGIGYFIADDACTRVRQLSAETFFNKEINYFFGRLKAFGTSPEQLSQLYSNFLNIQK